MAYLGAGITRFNTADGLTVKGTAEFTDTVVLGDSDELRFGAGEDLKIYHDASNSYIEDAGTGALIIRSNSFQAKSADNTTTMFTGAESGAVELYYNNVKRIETTSTGANVVGTFTADGLTVNTGTTDIATRFESTDGTAGIALSDNDGSVGILTRDTGDFSINVGGDASSSASNASEAIRILSDGKVGIGTTAPSTKIHLNESGSANAVQRIQAGTNGYAAQLHLYGNNVSGAAYNSVASYVNGDGTPQWEITGPEASAEDQMLLHTGGSERMRIDSSGNVGIGTNSPSSGLHLSGASTSSARMTFTQTTASATGKIQQGSTAFTISSDGALPMTFDVNGSEKARITSGGNVGIGTSSPQSNINSNSKVLNLKQDSTNGSGVVMESSNCITEINVGNNASYFYNYTSDPMLFGTNNTERLRITSGGNVGIGNSSPSHLLDATVSSGSATARFGTTHNSGNNHGTVIISNGGTGDAMLRFDYEGSNTDRARIGVTASGQQLEFYTAGNNERMRITSDGRLLHNTTSSTLGGDVVFKATNNNALTIHNARGTSGFFSQIQFSNNAGGAAIGSINRVNDASVQYNTTSDARLKENIADMTGAITRVKQLAPKRYSWVNEDLDAADQDGFLAHEAQAVVPIAVSGTQDEVDEDGNPVYMQMDYSKLVPLLTAALKESIAKIETLETEVAALKAAN